MIRDPNAIRLDIITVGEDAASEVYVRNKVKYATEVGIEVITHKFAHFEFF